MILAVTTGAIGSGVFDLTLRSRLPTIAALASQASLRCRLCSFRLRRLGLVGLGCGLFLGLSVGDAVADDFGAVSEAEGSSGVDDDSPDRRALTVCDLGAVSSGGLIMDFLLRPDEVANDFMRTFEPEYMEGLMGVDTDSSEGDASAAFDSGLMTSGVLLMNLYGARSRTL